MSVDVSDDVEDRPDDVDACADACEVVRGDRAPYPCGDQDRDQNDLAPDRPYDSERTSNSTSKAACRQTDSKL